jgi:hypothetical protein
MSGARRWAVTGLAWWRRGMLFHPFIVDPLSRTASCVAGQICQIVVFGVVTRTLTHRRSDAPRCMVD